MKLEWPIKTREQQQEYLATIVNRGASFLDQHAYKWEDRINVGALRMQAWDTCIFGQTFGFQWKGDGAHPSPYVGPTSCMQAFRNEDPKAEEIGTLSDWSFYYGFDLPLEFDKLVYPDLRREWLTQISVRRTDRGR